MMNDDFDDIPRARNRDPGTSHISASRLTTARSHCLAMLQQAYLISKDGSVFTDEALAERAGLREQGICWWHRASDLREKGYIAWVYTTTGQQYKVLGSNGRAVGVSRITNAGITAASAVLGHNTR